MNFQNFASELHKPGKELAELDSEHYIEQIEKVRTDFDFALFVPFATFMCFPFRDEHDVDSLASDMFQMNLAALEEILALQTEIQVKARAQSSKLLAEEKYPNIRIWATSLTAMFGSTYLFESAFSHMKIDY